MKATLLSTLLVAMLFYSCQKEIVFPVTTPPATTTISLQYQPLHNLSTKFELIITDSVHTVLLDSILNVNETHTLNFPEGPYSVTTIEYDDAEKKYKSKTYLNATATNWVIRPVDDKQNLGSSNISGGADAKLMYQNVPAFTGFAFYQGSQFQPGSTVSVTPIASQKKIEVSYKRLDQYIAYLMIPSLGLYKIHKTNSINDIADCAQMDSVKRFNYTKPSNLVDSYINLYGFLDANNYSNGIQLFRTDPQIFGTQYDIVYPQKGISQYFFYGLFSDDAGGQFIYNSLADAIPQSLQFIDNSYFRIVSNQNNDFQVEFLKETPGYYSIAHSSANLSHVIYSAPAETSVNPSQLVSVLSESKSLKGENLADYKISRFGYHTTDDYSFAEYFDFIYNPSSADGKINLGRTYTLPL